MYRSFSGTSKPNMPPIFDKPTTEKYDYVVIGGGSGGSGTSVRVILVYAFFFAEKSDDFVLYHHHRGELLPTARKLL